MNLREEIAELIGQRWPDGYSAASIADEIMKLVGEKGLRIVPVEPTEMIALLLSLLLDYLVSLAGARKYGASRAGLWGSVIGMLIGMIFFPPLGIFLGALVGAVVTEVLVGKKTGEAMRVGWGIFVGNMVGIVVKFAYCLMVLFFFIKELL